MRRLVARMIAPIAACALAACAVGPDYALPDEAMVRSETANGAFVESANNSLTPRPPPDDWWRLYRDPRLDRLIGQALAANTDLRTAEAILEKSAALLQQAEAARQPSVAVNFDTSYQQLSSEAYLQKQVVPGTSLYDSGVSVAYDLDLFGRLRRTVEAVNADDEAVAAARDLVKVNVVADTTRSFLDLCDTGAELSVARENLNVQRASLAVTRRLVEAGKGGSLDETRSRGLTAQLESALPTLEARQRNAVFRLATLTGRPPAEFDRSLSSCAAPPRILAPLPVGDGAQLLKRRRRILAIKRNDPRRGTAFGRGYGRDRRRDLVALSERQARGLGGLDRHDRRFPQRANQPLWRRAVDFLATQPKRRARPDRGGERRDECRLGALRRRRLAGSARDRKRVERLCA